MNFNSESYAGRPHRRFNPLTGEWILVSPHRLQRPWQGKVEKIEVDARPPYDPKCYLCPGNERAGGHLNPPYERTFVFTNDFAALLPPELAKVDSETGRKLSDPSGRTSDLLLRAESVSGTCRVICFSPRHDLTLARMSSVEIEAVVKVWTDQTRELAGDHTISYVQVFENKGALMGCSNPHPHGQIWAVGSVPTEPSLEDENQAKWFAAEGGKSRLLGEALELELTAGERVVYENDSWVVLVPFWAKWPFEILILPRRSEVHWLMDLAETESTDLADAIRNIAVRYDNLFETSFPYTMGIHQAPVDGRNVDHWTMHLHFFPPLLRSATVQKFMVGYEMLAEAQRDITAESAAQRLRDLSPIHYLEKANN